MLNTNTVTEIKKCLKFIGFQMESIQNLINNDDSDLMNFKIYNDDNHFKKIKDNFTPPNEPELFYNGNQEISERSSPRSNSDGLNMKQKSNDLKSKLKQSSDSNINIINQEYININIKNITNKKVSHTNKTDLRSFKNRLIYEYKNSSVSKENAHFMKNNIEQSLFKKSVQEMSEMKKMFKGYYDNVIKKIGKPENDDEDSITLEVDHIDKKKSFPNLDPDSIVNNENFIEKIKLNTFRKTTTTLKIDKNTMKTSFAGDNDSKQLRTETKVDLNLNFKIEPFNSDHFHSDSQVNIKLFNIHDFSAKHKQNYQLTNFQILEDSIQSQIWNIILLIVLSYQILMYPFVEWSESWMGDEQWYILSVMFIEQIFILDIIINCMTTFKNQLGYEVKTLSTIFNNYLRTWFVLDLVSAIPVRNLMQFGVLTDAYFISYIKVFRLPKYVKMLRIWYKNAINQLNLDQAVSKYLNISNSQQNMQINALKISVQFLLVCNALACYLISQTGPCYDYESCSNWFFFLMKDEQLYNLQSSSASHHLHYEAKMIDAEANTIEDAQLMFQSHALVDRELLYLNAQYFVVQTVTTVGQGDVSTISTSERSFRLICMIIGVVMFGQASSSVLESSITDSLNIQRNMENEAMIEKLQVKQELHGESYKQLSLLGDSVQVENLNSELNFIKKLPNQMKDTVLQDLYKIYQVKLNILKEENIEMFLKLMEVAKFRRCVMKEVIQTSERKIDIVQSGQIGCYIINLKNQIYYEYLQQIEPGDDIGYHCFMDFPKSQHNQVYTCTSNSELIEIDAVNFEIIMKSSTKGIKQIQDKVVDFMLNLQIILVLYQAMLMDGLQIDTRWQNRVMALMKFEHQDFEVMDNIQDMLNNQVKGHEIQSIFDESKQTWQNNFLNAETKKQIINKSNTLADLQISDFFKDLKSQATNIAISNMFKGKFLK